MRKKLIGIVFCMLMITSGFGTIMTIKAAADRGWTIETVDSAGNVGSWGTSITIDSYNNPHISYNDVTNWDLKYAWKSGSSWSTPITVDSSGNVGRYSSIALDSSNYPHISYLDSSNEKLKYAKWTGSSWSFTNPDPNVHVGMYTSIALETGTNRPHISYYDFSSLDLKHAYWTGSSWSYESVDTGGNVGWYSSIALDTSNRPYISYYDYTNEDLKLAYWTGSTWSKSTLDSNGDVGKYTSIALDSTNHYYISYTDMANYNLKCIRWTGSSYITETVDQSGDVGIDTSIAVGTNSKPQISYWDVTNINLKYAKWDSSWSTTPVDASGGYTSIALDSSNNPHISYSDGSNYDLQYAKYTLSTQKTLAMNACSHGTTSPTSPGMYTYNTGASVTIQAFPADGYHFTSWSGTYSGYENPYNFNINQDYVETANFAPNPTYYTLTMNACSHGTTSPTSPGMYTYNTGASVTIQAFPADGYHFTSWSGTYSGYENPYNFNINQDYLETANFVAYSPPYDPIADNPSNDQTGISIYLRELKCTVSHPNNLKMDVYFYWNQEGIATEIKTGVSSGSQVSFNIPIPMDKELNYETEYHWKIKAVDQYGKYAQKEFSFTTVDTPIELIETTYVGLPWTYSHHHDGPYCARSSADESTGDISGGITYFGDVTYMSTDAMLGTEKIIPDSSSFQDHFTFGMLRVDCDISSCYIYDLGWDNGNAKVRLYYKLYKNDVLIEENDLFVREKQATSDSDSWQLPNMQEIWYLEDSIKLNDIDHVNDLLLEGQEIKIEFWMNLSVSKFQYDNVEVGFSGEVYKMDFYGYRPDFYVNKDTITTNPKKPRRNEPVTVDVHVKNIGECHARYIGDGAIRGVCRLENVIYGVPVTDVSYDSQEDKIIRFEFTWPDRSGHEVKIHFDELNGENEYGTGCFDEVDEDNNRGSLAVSSEYTGFVRGSQITMANGLTQSIQNVQVGDYVLAVDEEYGSIEAVKVTYVHSTSAIDITDSFLIINKNLILTENQLICINGEWKPAGQVQLLDIIIQLQHDSLCPVEITSVRWLPDENYNCYALEVDPVASGECCYFVNNKLVHE